MILSVRADGEARDRIAALCVREHFALDIRRLRQSADHAWREILELGLIPRVHQNSIESLAVSERRVARQADPPMAD
jgi:hypothetical protein